MKVPNFEIKNVVAAGSLNQTFNLYELFKELEELGIETVYKPEIYPALYIRFKLENHRKHITLYQNGKFIIVGGHSRTQIFQIMDRLEFIMKQLGYL